MFKLIKNLIRAFQPCHKEQLGYTCRHQMHGTVKECGDAN